VLFPSLARLAARADMDGFRNTVTLGLRQIAFLLVPAGVVCAVLADPITRIVYQRGAWGPHETSVTAGALAAFAGGLVFNGAMLMLNRAFFSLQANWIPTIVALANLGLNAALDAAFYGFGTWGIPLATTVVNVAGTAVLLVLLRRRLGRLELAEAADSTARILVASAALAGVAFGIWYGVDRLVGRSFGGQVASVGLALTVGIAAYLVVAKALQVRELGALLALRARFTRA
jgi:putative peptidoglycan lipid II flippase